MADSFVIGGPGDLPYTTLQFGAVSSGAKKVGRLSLWQMQNQDIDASLRVGLPVGAFLAKKAGYKRLSMVSLAVAGTLWANRLLSLNL